MWCNKHLPTQMYDADKNKWSGHYSIQSKTCCAIFNYISLPIRGKDIDIKPYDKKSNI